MSDRDRDAGGRARNARPRDALGRPLPYGQAGVERAPEGVVRTPAQTVEQAQRLLDEGKPFHAHEVFEDAWKTTADPADRPLWQALAQLAVGLTHAARGNRAGRDAVLGRAIHGLQPIIASQPHGIDVAAVADWAMQARTGACTAPLRLSARAPLQ